MKYNEFKPINAERVKYMQREKSNQTQKSKHKFFRVIAVIFVAFCVLNTIGGLFMNHASVGYFKSTVGRTEYLATYDKALETLPKPSAILDINTSWGVVRVYEWVNEEYSDAPPVVLLPGHSSGSPMWQSNLIGFSKQHTVYALDALGDAGKSVQAVPLQKASDVSGWISEVFDGLGIERAHLVGHSFGGGYAADFARDYPEKVQTLTLLEPAFALNYPPFSTLFWASVGSIEFLPESWRNYGIAKLSGAKSSDVASDDPLAKMISAASTYYAASLPTPETLKTEELKNLEMPVYVALAETSAITGKKAEEQAALIPDVIVKVWANTTHSLPMEVPTELAQILNQFWARNE